MTFQESVIASFRRHVKEKTRFRHQGRTPEGLDCSGLFAVCAKELGIHVIDKPVHRKNLVKGQLRTELDIQPALEEIDELEPACLLLFEIDGVETHLALWTGSTMIHAWVMTRKVVEHDMDEYWRSRITGMYRIKEPG